MAAKNSRFDGELEAEGVSRAAKDSGEQRDEGQDRADHQPERSEALAEDPTSQELEDEHEQQRCREPGPAS